MQASASSKKCVCVCTCGCLCVYVCARVCTCVCVCVCTCVYVCVCLCVSFFVADGMKRTLLTSGCTCHLECLVNVCLCLKSFLKQGAGGVLGCVHLLLNQCQLRAQDKYAVARQYETTSGMGVLQVKTHGFPPCRGAGEHGRCQVRMRQRHAFSALLCHRRILGAVVGACSDPNEASFMQGKQTAHTE